MLPIEVHNVGPVEEFSAELSPGVTVLHGENGVGKTTVLRTVDVAANGRSDRKPTKRDGVPKGTAVVAGRTLTITRSIRTEGELTENVSGVGDLSIDVLHSPKFDSAPVRDRHRIATLLRLAGVKADASLFWDLVGGADAFARLVDADSLKTDDLVELAARIKRRMEKHAQDAERDASTAEQRQAAEAAQASGVDLTQPDDAAALQQALDAATRRTIELEQQRRAADEALGRAAAARERMQSLPPAPEIAALEDAETAACRASDFAEIERKTAWEAYQAAEHRRVDAARALEIATAVREAAEREATIRAELQRTIDEASSVASPTNDELNTDARQVLAAQAAIEYGVKVRQAKAAIQRSTEYAVAAKDAAKRAERFRRAAADTQAVLSDAIGRIPNCPLRVIYDTDGDARLVMRTPRSDLEPFDERSDGERWRTVLEIAATPDTLLVLPQAAWGELADGTRSEIDRIARERGAYILTAQADDGELRAEPWRNELAEQQDAALAAARE